MSVLQRFGACDALASSGRRPLCPRAPRGGSIVAGRSHRIPLWPGPSRFALVPLHRRGVPACSSSGSMVSRPSPSATVTPSPPAAPRSAVSGARRVCFRGGSPSRRCEGGACLFHPSGQTRSRDSTWHVWAHRNLFRINKQMSLFL